MPEFSVTPRTGQFAGQAVFTNSHGHGIFTRAAGGWLRQHTGTSQTPTFRSARHFAGWLRRHYPDDAQAYAQEQRREQRSSGYFATQRRAATVAQRLSRLDAVVWFVVKLTYPNGDFFFATWPQGRTPPFTESLRAVQAFERGQELAVPASGEMRTGESWEAAVNA